MRARAEEYFQMHRERGGFAAMRDPGTPVELRSALFELKKIGNLLWQRAAELVQAAGDSVLRDSQVSPSITHLPATWGWSEVQI